MTRRMLLALFLCLCGASAVLVLLVLTPSAQGQTDKPTRPPAMELGCNRLMCGQGYMCERAANSCGKPESESTGICIEVPQVCAAIYRPVCGCDDKTYGNDCERRAARVQKKADGPC